MASINRSVVGVSVSRSSTHGMGLFGRRDFEIGDTICVESPLIFVPSNPAVEETLTDHRLIDGNTVMDAKQLIHALRTQLNSILISELTQFHFHQESGSSATASSSDIIIRPLVDLLTENGKYDDIILSKDDDSLRLSRNQFETIIRVIYSNGLRLRIDDDTVLGSGVFRYTSRANHSCSPNAEWTVVSSMTTSSEALDDSSSHSRVTCREDISIVLRAVRPIARNEEILISYLNGADIFEPILHRRHILNTGWHFPCHCVRCSHDFDDTRRFLCPKCKRGSISVAPYATHVDLEMVDEDNGDGVRRHTSFSMSNDDSKKREESEDPNQDSFLEEVSLFSDCRCCGWTFDWNNDEERKALTRCLKREHNFLHGRFWTNLRNDTPPLDPNDLSQDSSLHPENMDESIHEKARRIAQQYSKLCKFLHVTHWILLNLTWPLAALTAQAASQKVPESEQTATQVLRRSPSRYRSLTMESVVEILRARIVAMNSIVNEPNFRLLDSYCEMVHVLHGFIDESVNMKGSKTSGSRTKKNWMKQGWYYSQLCVRQCCVLLPQHDPKVHWAVNFLCDFERGLDAEDVPCQDNICAVCGRSMVVNKCARCKNVYYCSRLHQKWHWKAHKLKCPTV